MVDRLFAGRGRRWRRKKQTRLGDWRQVDRQERQRHLFDDDTFPVAITVFLRPIHEFKEAMYQSPLLCVRLPRKMTHVVMRGNPRKGTIRQMKENACDVMLTRFVVHVMKVITQKVSRMMPVCSMNQNVHVSVLLTDAIIGVRVF